MSVASLSSRQTGTLGENIAIRYLKKNAYHIVQRNWTSRWAEIDIIALHNNTLIFVEVKTRRGVSFGTPEDLYTSFKQNTFSRAIQQYIHQQKLTETAAIRIDLIVIVILNGTQYRLKHYKNIDISA